MKVTEEQQRQMQHTAAVEVGETAMKQARPSVLYRPALVFRDGNWMAILGDDPAIHLTGIGDSPAAAMENFDVLFMLAARPLGAPEPHPDEGMHRPTLDAVIEALSAPCPTPSRSTPLLGNAAVVEWAQHRMIERVKSLMTG